MTRNFLRFSFALTSAVASSVALEAASDRIASVLYLNGADPKSTAVIDAGLREDELVGVYKPVGGWTTLRLKATEIATPSSYRRLGIIAVFSVPVPAGGEPDWLRVERALGEEKLVLVKFERPLPGAARSVVIAGTSYEVYGCGTDDPDCPAMTSTGLRDRAMLHPIQRMWIAVRDVPGAAEPDLRVVAISDTGTRN
jgi:hypothetical protein